VLAGLVGPTLGPLAALAAQQHLQPLLGLSLRVAALVVQV
jgi:hypothetical protein